MNERIKILLIEDDKVDQMAFLRIKDEQNLPYDYTIIQSVTEFQNLTDLSQFDIVITDYNITDGTAFDIIGSLHNIPSILITGSGDEEIAVKAMKMGAYDYLVKDQYSNYIKMLPVTIENVLKRQKAKETYRLLSHAITSINDGVSITDMDGNIIFVNKAFCEMYGYEEDEIIGKHISITWNNTDTKSSSRKKSKNGFTAQVSKECVHKNKNGDAFPIHISRSQVKDEAGNDVAIVAVARDISERVKAEKALERERDLLHALMDNIPDTIYFKDTDSKFTRINKAQAELIGLNDPQEAIGKTDMDFFEQAHAEAAFNDEQNIVKTGTPLIGKIEQLKQNDGAFKWVSATKVPITNGSGNVSGLVGISRDITSHIQTEAQLKKSLEEKEVLLREIHHRVKNNMQVIFSLLNLQSRRVKDEKMLGIFKDCQNRIKSMALIHEYLYQTTDFVNIDFTTYIESLANNLFNMYNAGTNISLGLNANEVQLGMDAAVPCGLIVNELMSNSLKHAFPDNRPGVVTVDLEKTNGKICLTVKDNGVGIPQSIDFKNTDSLGLQLVNALTDQLNGEIQLTEDNGFTKFAVTF